MLKWHILAKGISKIEINMSATSKNQPKSYIPIPIFDGVEELSAGIMPSYVPEPFYKEYKLAADFLLSYKNNEETFKTYRREIERFVQWTCFFAKLSIKSLKRADLENYLIFCRKPDNNWIGVYTVPKFIEIDGIRQPNPKWRPYVVKISKAQTKAGEIPRPAKYKLSDKGFREIFTILQGFYKYLIQADYLEMNLIDLIKQKSTYYRTQTKQKIRRIPELQWDVLIETAETMAERDPQKHERTLFIISLLYGLYLRVSELAASDRWTPYMQHFEKDYEGNWWFRTVGKGNKERTIAVSPPVLKALIRWRNYLKLPSELPLIGEATLLIHGRSLNSPIESTRQIRNIVQACFDEAVIKLRNEGFEHEAAELEQATVHWLRHTGISEDVKHRPREHVRDDAGHSSSLITDRYIDVDTRERHKSAQDKIFRH